VPSDTRGIDRIQYSSNLELVARLILLIKQELPQPPLRSDSAFDSIKSKIVEKLRTSAGLNLSRLVELVGEDKTLVQSTVRVLVQAGDLSTKGQKRGTIYFTNDADLEQDVKARILEHLKVGGGVTISKPVSSLGEDRALVQSAIRSLMQAGEVRTRGVKRGTTYFTGDTDFRTLSRKR
jgi:predicted transcriptional regulator